MIFVGLMLWVIKILSSVGPNVLDDHSINLCRPNALDDQSIELVGLMLWRSNAIYPYTLEAHCFEDLMP